MAFSILTAKQPVSWKTFQPAYAAVTLTAWVLIKRTARVQAVLSYLSFLQRQRYAHSLVLLVVSLAFHLGQTGAAPQIHPPDLLAAFALTDFDATIRTLKQNREF